jgi:hypothetical protein
MLAVTGEGRDVTIIEGAGRRGGLHAMRRAFATHDAFPVSEDHLKAEGKSGVVDGALVNFD